MPNYVEQYNSYLDKALRGIEKEITGLIRIIDNSKSAQQKMTILIANRLQIIEEIRKAGTESFNLTTSGVYAKEFKASNSFFKQAGIATTFLKTDLSAFKEIPIGALQKIVSYGHIDGTDIYGELLKYSLDGNCKALERGLLSNLNKLKISRYGGTITNTSISTFNRTVTGTKAIRAGVKEFEYAGPPPQRAWCNDVGVGTVLTREQIEGLPPNIGGMDPFYTAGGWNCKHRWVPVL